MKTIKLTLPALVFVLATATALRTQATNALVQLTPDHFRGAENCPSCVVPNTPGNMHGTNYVCNTFPLSNIRCTCLFGVISLEATSTGSGGPTCIALWREQLIP